MTDQLSLFTYQLETKPCWRWYRKDKCWDCPAFVHHCQQACGSCRECETPYGDWFVGCDYNMKVGRKIDEQGSK